jgi:predicted dehydrogenase
MSGQLKVGIIGAGSIVRSRHMPGLRAIDGVSVVGVCNRRTETAERFAADYDVPQVITHWPDLIARDDIDVVWIGTTPHLHKEITLAALAAGKHVFRQDRMCLNLAEAREMVAAADAHPDLVTMICPPPMGMPGDRVMRRLLQRERYVGQMRHVHLRNLSATCLDPGADLHWRLDRSLSGQNAFAMGIYIEVLNRWIGPARRVTAVTRIWTQFRPHPETRKPTPVEIPEALNIIAELENDGIGFYQVNGVSAHAPSDMLEIYGTEGTLHYHFDGSGNERIFGAKRSDGKLAEIAIPPGEHRPWTVEADFIRAVRTGDKSVIEPNFHHGIQYMAFIDAVHRSAESRRSVDVAKVS